LDIIALLSEALGKRKNSLIEANTRKTSLGSMIGFTANSVKVAKARRLGEKAEI
jgi:hypothetical protein